MLNHAALAHSPGDHALIHTRSADITPGSHAHTHTHTHTHRLHCICGQRCIFFPHSCYRIRAFILHTVAVRRAFQEQCVLFTWFKVTAHCSLWTAGLLVKDFNVKERAVDLTFCQWILNVCDNVRKVVWMFCHLLEQLNISMKCSITALCKTE